MRDRLIELLDYIGEHPEKTCPNFNSKSGCKGCKYDELDDCYSSRKADYLLANGVIVPPCKIGDTIYTVGIGEVEASVVIAMAFECNANGIEGEGLAVGKHTTEFAFRNIGKTVFLSREEAEKALKGKDEGK